MLKNSVPEDCTDVAHQSIRSGSHVTSRQRCGPRVPGGPFRVATSRYCSSPADVKKSDPKKKVSRPQSDRRPSNSQAAHRGQSRPTQRRRAPRSTTRSPPAPTTWIHGACRAPVRACGCPTTSKRSLNHRGGTARGSDERPRPIGVDNRPTVGQPEPASQSHGTRSEARMDSDTRVDHVETSDLLTHRPAGDDRGCETDTTAWVLPTTAVLAVRHSLRRLHAANETCSETLSIPLEDRTAGSSSRTSGERTRHISLHRGDAAALDLPLGLRSK